ncbi:N-acetylglucosamine-1-phosphodiester alpha-N-acetylglucosaminidase-like [Myripristis murdjan]|uniref:N-acetylglucosamine-1-phosphodiester alpha-N-acetylglucosaminidase-like n=1 Tax=Myripristis murdjan TaxID=586833 RepID=UPI001175F2E8|nr:N-acetylglucosamine-1-phosphodiester alpha-N-acetylglucosaminidase-like [Myripristis murdjan]
MWSSRRKPGRRTERTSSPHEERTDTTDPGLSGCETTELTPPPSCCCHGNVPSKVPLGAGRALALGLAFRDHTNELRDVLMEIFYTSSYHHHHPAVVPTTPSPLHALRNKASEDDDLLLPYASSHGPSHSHRHVRDCQPVAHGNVTHETWPASNHTGLPAAESSVFVSDVAGGSRKVYGHMTVVHDPLRTVSVLEPGGPGGCGMNYRALVEETARAAGCLYAQNAGFFNTRSGECLGNVVSDGRVVRDSGGVQNAQFGIRRDGTLVFGYLSQEDVLDQSNPFVQLISGVVWLLRDGQVYINQSMEAECDKTNEMEGFHYFVNVLSARTAVGHDAEGRLVLFHSDGQTKERGMNLWEVAEFLKEHGVINAVNLDGGGSSTFVINGSLASYPPDRCKPDDRWRCARPVSTVLCVHPRRCQPADCSGHGECVDGRCRCQAGWRGDACDALLCQHTCGAHGVCTVNGCVCDAGWRGRSCDKLCPLGFYGRSCAEECQCEDQCPCDPITGSCTTNGLILRTAGRCLSRRMFPTWRRDEAHRDRTHLTERTWLIITVTLASLLLIKVVGQLIRSYRRSANERLLLSYQVSSKSQDGVCPC